MKTVILVGAEPAIATAVSSEGEVLWEVSIPPGMHDAEQYYALLEEGEGFRFENAIVREQQRKRRSLSPARPKSQFETGANQDFQPSKEDIEAAKLHKTMKDVQRSIKEAQRLNDDTRRMREEYRDAEAAAAAEAERERQAEEQAEAERQAAREAEEAAAAADDS